MQPMLRIRAWNFRSFRHLAYTVNPAGLVAVEGMYEGTKDRSNGAGKSTFLPEVLCWAIYGETTGGKTQACSTDPDAESVRVEVELPFISWARTQKRDGTGKNIELNGIRNYTDALPELLKHFPPKKVFTSTMILGQGVGERFSTWTPGVRAQALGELLNLSRWADARKRLSIDRTRLKGDLARAEGAVGAYEAQYRELSQAPQGDPKKRSAASSKVAKFAGEAQRLQVEYSTCNQEAVSTAQLLGQWNAQMSMLRQTISDCQTQAGGIRTGVLCPTCNRAYPKTAIAEMVKAVIVREKEAATSLSNIQGEFTKLQKTAVENKKKLDALGPKVSKSRADLSKAEQELAATDNHQEQLKSIEAVHTAERQKAEGLVSRVANLDLLDRGFFEIPIWKIDGVLGVLNERLVEVCNTIWESEFLVQLTSEQQLKKGGAKAEIGLVVQNKAGDYQGSSPGQQRKIDITIQLAIRELLMSAWPNALPLLVCDDVVDVLDPWAKRTFYKNYLLEAAKRSAVFVLTPQSEYPVPVDHKVLVQYTEESGSWIAQSTASPVVEFDA